MSARAPAIAVALTCALLAWLALPPPAHVLPGSAPARALGPLRPVVAAVVRLRFEARRRDEEVLGQLDDAWRILALLPESVPDFGYYAAWCLFDAPTVARAAGERDACLAAGFELLAAGRSLHPDAWLLDWVEARALTTFARLAPDRLRQARLPAGATACGHALVLLDRAAAHAADARERELVAMERESCAREVLADPAASDEEKARARSGSG